LSNPFIQAIDQATLPKSENPKQTDWYNRRRDILAEVGSALHRDEKVEITDEMRELGIDGIILERVWFHCKKKEAAERFRDEDDRSGDPNPVTFS
jgi:hypothetical protein